MSDNRFAIGLALSCVFISFTILALGHIAKVRRIKALNFKYDQSFDPLAPHQNEIISILDIERCHWCYMLVRDLWGNPKVKEYIESKGLTLRYISLQ